MIEHHEASSEGGAPEYMVSYADMLTIMLAFFIVLYATAGTTSDGKDKGEKSGKGVAARENPAGAQQGAGAKEGPGGKDGIGRRPKGGAVSSRESQQLKDASKPSLDKVFESLYYRFGPDWTISNCWSGGPPQLRLSPADETAAAPAGKDAVRGLRGRSGDDPYRARSAKPADSLLVAGRIYFDDFSAELQGPQKAKLRRAIDELAGKVQKIDVRGHTSRRPIPSGRPYHDRWELAFARSRTVKDLLVAGGIDPARIRLSVAADYEPLEIDGETPHGKSDARVEIHWLNEYLDAPSGTR